MKNKKNMKLGQSTVEIAVLFMLVAGVLLLARIYIKRSLGAKIKTSADSISGGQSYDFDTLKSDHTVITSTRKTTEVVSGRGRVDTAVHQYDQNYSHNIEIDDIFGNGD